MFRPRLQPCSLSWVTRSTYLLWYETDSCCSRQVANRYPKKSQEPSKNDKRKLNSSGAHVMDQWCSTTPVIEKLLQWDSYRSCDLPNGWNCDYVAVCPNFLTRDPVKSSVNFSHKVTAWGWLLLASNLSCFFFKTNMSRADMTTNRRNSFCCFWFQSWNRASEMSV